jgi:hypothetical protein
MFYPTRVATHILNNGYDDVVKYETPNVSGHISSTEMRKISLRKGYFIMSSFNAKSFHHRAAVEHYHGISL